MTLDLLIIILIGWFTIRGVRRGLIMSLAGFAGFVLASTLSLTLRGVVAVPLRTVVSDSLAELLAVVLIYALVGSGVWIAARVVKGALRMSKWRILDRAGGAAVGGAWAIAIAAVISLIASVLPGPKAVVASYDRSQLAKAIASDAPGWARTIARTDVRDVLDPYVAPKEKKVAVVATAEFVHAPRAEADLFALINAERRARDLVPLAWNERVATAARAHASDMYARGYFAHRGSDGRGPKQRVQTTGIRFTLIGENLALSTVVRRAHNELMVSDVHRREILDERFDAVGIGVMSGRQGLMIVQDFVARA